MTELLALLTLAVVAAGLGAVITRLRHVSDKVDALGSQLQQTRTAGGQAIESLGQRMRAAEQAAAHAEETGRAVSRQLIELNRVTVDQAVILVAVRDDLMKRLPGPDGRRPKAIQAGSNGGTA